MLVIPSYCFLTQYSIFGREEKRSIHGDGFRAEGQVQSVTGEAAREPEGVLGTQGGVEVPLVDPVCKVPAPKEEAT